MNARACVRSVLIDAKIYKFISTYQSSRVPANNSQKPSNLVINYDKKVSEQANHLKHRGLSLGVPIVVPCSIIFPI